MKKPKVIAFYLPQFHSIPENDLWWGKGFTEWVNVKKAKPLFRGHYQPHVPTELGYYDLTCSEIRERQAELAREAGVAGFCYWHYWFGNGKRLLAEIFDDVIRLKTPDFPLCLGWANHSWYMKTWDKNGTDKLLIEQVYGSEEDYICHFNYALKAFSDDRYLKIDGRPIFFIYDAMAVPDDFLRIWQKMAKDNGFEGICFIGRIKNNDEYEKILSKGFSYITCERINNIQTSKSVLSKRISQCLHLLGGKPINCYSYSKACSFFINTEIDSKPNFIPTIIPNWDHSPRSGNRGFILNGSTPELFRKHIREVFQVLRGKTSEHQIVFLKSWNEWAEGNYMEPDSRWGKQYIRTLREELELYSHS